jgi:hypothetical protein
MSLENLSPEEELRLQAEFDRISRELDSPEAVARLDAAINAKLLPEIREHQRFLAESRALAHSHVVYR